MKKKQILEIIDDNFNIINNDEPQYSPNKESEANNTTDYNKPIHTQGFTNDFYGRFGFYFYESKFIKGNKLNEDVLTNKDNEVLIKTKNIDGEVLDKLEKLSDLLSKLNKNEQEKIMSLFEKYLK